MSCGIAVATGDASVVDVLGEFAVEEEIVGDFIFPATTDPASDVGEVDYLLRIVAKDWEGYQAFLTEHLTAADNVSSVKTMLLVRSSKERPGVPVEIE